MEIIENFIARVGGARAGDVLSMVWERAILKRDAQGIHGALYDDYSTKREHIPLRNREASLNPGGFSAAQGKLFAQRRKN
jgi:hypothetical protein